MIKQWFNVRSLLFLVALVIVTGTIFYSKYLSEKIAKDEKQRVELWASAQRAIVSAVDPVSLNLATSISIENKDIPIIETNENDSINPYNSVNLDSSKIREDSTYLQSKLKDFKSLHDPIVVVLSDTPYKANKYYYGESILQQEVRYYPIVQLIIVALFIAVIVIAQRISYNSTQNQLWAGMAKETAHQLGTPVTSLKGWVEVLKEMPDNEMLVSEIEKDVTRLNLITDRFGKIGSKPNLEKRNIIEQVAAMLEYIKKRAGGKVEFVFNTHMHQQIMAAISPPLFDWVIENLLKNALDAMEGKGRLTVNITQDATHTIIDITDTGKGISKQHINQVFNPGFTTKKRGWGLGLTLAKRIVEQYHKGQIFVKNSDIGKGTTFRILLNKSV